jgi:hypothetical protein
MSCENNCNNSAYRISGAFAHTYPCVAFPIQSDNLTYSGSNLPYTGINTCNTITVALQKIDEKIGELVLLIAELHP